jgi:hypothetical protein
MDVNQHNYGVSDTRNYSNPSYVTKIEDTNVQYRNTENANL